jgi:hypothetical protein
MAKKMNKKMTQGMIALAVVLLVVYVLKVQGLVEFNVGEGVGKQGSVAGTEKSKKSKKCKCTEERERLDIVKKCYPTFVKCMGK